MREAGEGEDLGGCDFEDEVDPKVADQVEDVPLKVRKAVHKDHRTLGPASGRSVIRMMKAAGATPVSMKYASIGVAQSVSQSKPHRRPRRLRRQGDPWASTTGSPSN